MRYAIWNTHQGKFLGPMDHTTPDTFSDKEELFKFFQDQVDTHDLDDIAHLRVVKVEIADDVDEEAAEVVQVE